MAAIPMKHTSSTDILFPEEVASENYHHQTLDDSFYSQPSNSSYSTYSQEVKYIFNPNVASTTAATRGPSSQESEYSEIDHLSMVSSCSRNSVDTVSSRRVQGPRSGSCEASPGGRLTEHWPSGSQGGIGGRREFYSPDHKYGLSIKPVAKYPPHFRSMDNINIWQNNNNVGNSYPDCTQGPVRHNSADGVSPASRADKPVPHRSYSSEGKFQATPTPLTRSGPLPKTPPKPKRSLLPHQSHKPISNSKTPENKLDRQLPQHPKQQQWQQSAQPQQQQQWQQSAQPQQQQQQQNQQQQHHQQNQQQQQHQQEIYATPVLNARVFRNSNSQGPPVPPHPNYDKSMTTSQELPPPGYEKPVGTVHEPQSSSAHQKMGKSDFDVFASRRRTWSPPTFSRLLSESVGSQLQVMRCYHSNDQLDVVCGDNTYEDLDTMSNSSAPPKLTPQSGQLNKVPHERIIKPIAFKPIVTPGSRYTNTTTLHRPSPQSPSSTIRPAPAPGVSNTLPMSPRHDHTTIRLANHSQDDGYISQDNNHPNNLLMHGGNMAMDTSQNSSQHGGGPVINGFGFANGYKTSSSDTRSESYTSSNLSRVSSNPGVDVSMATPSPSDSGVVDMEALLRSKDAEIAQLRETMEKNESAILKVYEEKRQNWQVEVREYADEWDRRLRAQTQKAAKTEQSLLMQIFTLQQERKALRTEADQYRAERDTNEKRLTEASTELNSAKTKLEELQWELHNKSGEIGMLKTQLKDAKDDTTSKTTDLVGLRTQVRELSQEREQNAVEVSKLRGDLQLSQEDLQKLQAKLDVTLGELEEVKRQAEELRLQSDSSNNNSTVTVSNLETELCRLRTEYGDAKTTFQKERDQWLDEKNKVIRYQKHLQLNYVQMVRKNKMMEAEIEQLTLELENRDVKLMADGLPVTEEESVC